MNILVGLSGGLDSTYAAYTLVRLGHRVEGAVLRMGDFTDLSGARRAADMLGIPLRVIDCGKEFEDTVIKYFTDEYLRGRTPNPCVVCNRYIKINRLCAFAAENGFDKAATGHYARTARGENGRYFVCRAADTGKDQSYMLWMLTQSELSALMTPLSELTKEEVRRRAAEAGFEEIAALPESQDVCFVPDNDYARFITERRGISPCGDFVDENGRVLGKHKGIIYYTVGQKKGLGIALGRQYTVKSVSAEDNTVCIVPAEDEEKLVYSDRVIIKDVNLQMLSPGTKEARGEAKLRYAAKPAGATVRIYGERAELRFDKPQRAAAKGQSLVLYIKDAVALGGVIEETLR